MQTWYAKIMADGCAQCMEAVGEVSKRRPVSGEFLTLADPVTDSPQVAEGLIGCGDHGLC